MSKPATYFVVVSREHDCTRCLVYRGRGWRGIGARYLVTMTKGRGAADAVKEARRQIRIARVAGQLG